MRRFWARSLLGVCMLILALAWTGPTAAATGDRVGTVHFSQDCGSGIGVGIAYDGAGHLWVSCYASNPDLLRANPTTGVVDQTYNITNGLGALAYDATRNGLWAGWGAGQPAGTVTFIQLDATKSVSGSNVAFTAPQDVVFGLDDGIAYDATDDTLYISDDGSRVVHQHTTTGVPIRNIPWAGNGCFNSGVGVGGSLLFEGSDGCSHVWVVDKVTNALAFDFSTAVPGDPNFRDEGLTCDTETFAPTQVMWSKEAFSPNRAAAFEIPKDTCGVGGQPPGPGPPANLMLTPATATNQAGQQHCVTATVTDAAGTPVSGVTVPFSVTGANPASGTGTSPTDANGQAGFCYTGTAVGDDTIAAYADTNGDGVQSPGEPGNTVAKTWTAGPPARLTLTPQTATNTVDSQHCVTATVTDAFANPTPGVTVRFSVTGSVQTSGPRLTDAKGLATFCYEGPALPGADVIVSFADTNGSGVQDAGEPSDRGAKEWVVPLSTRGCKVTGGGRITAAGGDKATFGGNAKVSSSGLPSGSEEYKDHGPATHLDIHSAAVLAVACSGNTASVFGTATINGSGSYNYRIDLTDNGEPGIRADRYRIRLATGYDSGERILAGGNIQLHSQ
ncbi:MAG: Ig-like domain-containing protein [Gaiellaceae bacterium]